MGLSRINVHQNKETGLMTVACTKDQVEWMKDLFIKICPIEFLSSVISTEDTMNEDGEVFKDFVVFKFRAEPDVVDVFFEAARTVLRQNIEGSFTNSAN